MWGKWVQNQTRPRIQSSTQKEFYELLTSLGTEVTKLIFPNEEVESVSWNYSDDNVTSGKNVNVAVAAYVTTEARLKLYEYLRKLGQSVLYCDTASVIHVHKVDEPPKVKTGYYLGDLTNELEEFGSGSFVDQFVSGGPKNYAFSVICPSTGKRNLSLK